MTTEVLLLETGVVRLVQLRQVGHAMEPLRLFVLLSLMMDKSLVQRFVMTGYLEMEKDVQQMVLEYYLDGLALAPQHAHAPQFVETT